MIDRDYITTIDLIRHTCNQDKELVKRADEVIEDCPIKNHFNLKAEESI